MEIVRIPRVLQNSLLKSRLQGRPIGFVPTMGALHAGHMSLVRTARQENDIVIASIFVNPAQFGPNEDFDKYPRDFEGDSRQLAEAGVDTLFVPEASSMYPEGFSTHIEVGGLSDKLCGAFRPGHFRGVATVVTKLLNLVSPTRAYFGQKDYQQCIIIRRLVKDLSMDVEIVMCPTLREPDGLAMSSRNRYLTPEDRKAAGVLYKALSDASGVLKSGIIDIREIIGAMRDALASEPRVSEVEYASVYDPETLIELPELPGAVALLALAARVGGVRLIDNMLVEMPR